MNWLNVFYSWQNKARITMKVELIWFSWLFAKVKIVAMAAAVFLLFLTGCAPSVRIAVTRPAEINLIGIKRLTIGNISGNTGFALYNLLTQKIFESGRYELLDRQNINALLREHNLTLSGLVDESTSVKIGGFLGASALIVGSSHGQYQQRTEIGKRYECSKKDGVCRDYRKIGEGRINTVLKVIDLKTGKIIAVKNFTDGHSDMIWEANAWPPDPDRDVIMGTILSKTVDSFMKMIAPYTDYVSVAFEDSKMPEVKAGIASAQSGQWESASIQFKNATDINPYETAAWYNSGLACMYTYQFDHAIQAFNRANALNPSSKYAQAIANCYQAKYEKDRLDEQVGGRSK